MILDLVFLAFACISAILVWGFGFPRRSDPQIERKLPIIGLAAYYRQGTSWIFLLFTLSLVLKYSNFSSEGQWLSFVASIILLTTLLKISRISIKRIK